MRPPHLQALLVGADRTALQLAIPVALREPFFEAFYERMGGPGVVDRTYAALKEKVFWS